MKTRGTKNTDLNYYYYFFFKKTNYCMVCWHKAFIFMHDFWGSIPRKK